jgi:NAD(P)-binding Rossmann-like domain
LPEGRKIAVVGAGPAGLSYASLAARRNKVTVFEKAEYAGGSFRIAGLAPKFQDVEAAPGPLLRYIAGLERACREQGTTFRFGCDVTKNPEVLDGFEQIVVAAGSRYRARLGFIPALVRAGLARLPVMRKIATNPKVRDWFYHRARVSAADRIAARLAGKKLSLIGDAARPGKSGAVILSAFEAAF